MERLNKFSLLINCTFEQVENIFFYFDKSNGSKPTKYLYGHYIYKQNEDSDFVYFLMEGEVEFRVNNQHKIKSNKEK